MTFGEGYAFAYDALYADKDYKAEIDLLEGVFASASTPVSSVLDLGCGTGGHASELARRGYEVLGVDVSEAMLEHARRRRDPAWRDRLEFAQGDIRTLKVRKRYDAVISMFAVLGYQLTDGDVGAALATVRRGLNPGGVFVFDAWYGPAVEALGPSERVKVVRTPKGEIERHASGRIDLDGHICTVNYELVRRQTGVADVHTRETHQVRYFFPDELERFMTSSGLRLRSLAAFPEVDCPATPDSWNVLATVDG